MRVSVLINALKGIALFGLLGPAIGVVLVALPAMATASDWSFYSLLLLVPATYFVGGIPAAICGLLAGMVRTRLSRFQGSVAAGVMGTACSVGYLLLMSGPNALGITAALFAMTGFTSGLVCGIVFFAPPNNSFKPKPLRGSA